MDAELPAAVPHQRLLLMTLIFGEIPKERFSVSIKVVQTPPLLTASIFHAGVIVILSVTSRSSIFKSRFHPS